MDPDDLNTERIATVFGGTGFLGRRIVKRLLERGFTVRAASRHPARVGPVFSSTARMPEAVEADILGCVLDRLGHCRITGDRECCQSLCRAGCADV
ncbi:MULTISPECIES: NAD-dependent epimerase/dehydratase family protein [unclassified Mesorhizobium]|uniref:NAD-dependent epimerase/dehydratase family protein n=1 Tax=unclassified Mesorhizobium TaxID=325217 RepID=UPI0032AF8391